MKMDILLDMRLTASAYDGPPLADGETPLVELIIDDHGETMRAGLSRQQAEQLSDFLNELLIQDKPLKVLYRSLYLEALDILEAWSAAPTTRANINRARAFIANPKAVIEAENRRQSTNEDAKR